MTSRSASQWSDVSEPLPAAPTTLPASVPIPARSRNDRRSIVPETIWLLHNTLGRRWLGASLDRTANDARVLWLVVRIARVAEIGINWVVGV